MQAAITSYRRLGGLNNKHPLLTVLEAGKPRIKGPADLAPGERQLPGLQMAFLFCSHMAASRGRKQVLYHLFLIRALILFIKRADVPNDLPIPSHRGLGFQPMNGRRAQTHILAITLGLKVEILS